MASYFEAAGEIGSAAEILQKAVARHPEDLWVNYRLAANLQFATPSRLRVGALLHRCSRHSADDCHMLAHALYELRQAADGKAVFLDLAARQPQMPGHLVCLAKELSRRGRTREAEAIADQVIPALLAEIRVNPSAECSLTLVEMRVQRAMLLGHSRRWATSRKWLLIYASEPASLLATSC